MDTINNDLTNLLQQMGVHQVLIFQYMDLKVYEWG